MEHIKIKSKIDIVQIMSNYPLKNLRDIPSMNIGKFYMCGIYRVLLKFPIQYIPENVVIIKASLKLFAEGAYNQNKVTPYALMEKWIPEDVLWSNQPAYCKKIKGECVNIRNSGIYDFDITSIIKLWYEKEIDNNGILLKSREIEDYNAFIEILSDTYMMSGPLVEIIYALKYDVYTTKFIEKIQELDTYRYYKFSKIINTSLAKAITFTIKNIGNFSVIANVQISSDRKDFINEKKYTLIKPGETVVLVPYVFAKYTRIAVRNETSCIPSKIKVTYQAQE